MQPLDTYDLVINTLVVVMMPLIIWANLRQSGLKSPLNVYLWREHPNLMRVSLTIIGLLALYSASELLGYFGLISAAAVDKAAFLFGIPFLIAAVAMIWLAAAAALKVLRDRRARNKV